MVNAMASFQPAGKYQTPIFSAKPSNRDPRTAPLILPIPPTIAAITPFNNIPNPMVGSRLVSNEIRIPDSPARADPKRKANNTRI